MTRLLALGLLAVGACQHRPVDRPVDPAGEKPPERPAAARGPNLLAATAASPSPPPPLVTVDGDSHPLKVWMTANLARHLKTGRFEELARLLSTAANFAPPGFTDWAAIAQRGRQAALARDIDDVRATCSECHDKYRTAYRRTLHNQPLPLER